MFTPAYRRYVLGALTSINTLNYLDGVAIILFLQPIKEDLHLSDTELGFLTGIAFALFYATLGVPIARWADRGNRVTIASLAIGLWGGTVMLCLYVRSFPQLLLARVAAGVGESGCMPPTYSLLADYFPDAGERTRAMSIYLLASPLAALIGFALGGWLNDAFGWRVAFFLLGTPALAVALLVKLTVVEPRVHTRQVRGLSVRWPRVLSCVWHQASTRHLSIAIVLLWTMLSGLGPWYAAFLSRSHGMTTGALGVWLGGIFGISGMIGTYLGGYVAARFFSANERGQMRFTAIMVALLVPSFVLFLLVDGRTEALLALSPLVIVNSLFAGPAFALLQRLVPEQMRATTMALVMLFANLIGTGAGPQVVGILSDALQPTLGIESLRYAMLMMSFLAWWSAYHFWRAGRDVSKDLESVALSESAEGVATGDGGKAMPDSGSGSLATVTPVQIQWGIRIPTRDGTRLAATLYLPSADVRPVPALFTLTPYIGQRYHDEAMYFAARGYAFATVDVHGRGDSEGTFVPLIGSGAEGFDVVDWLSQQPFCTGDVAMWGGSYAGHAQWATAAEVPAALRCIAPVASPYVGVDFPMRKNVFSPYLIQWLVLVSGRAAQDNVFADQVRVWNSRFAQWVEAGLPFNQLDRHSGYPSSIFQEWIKHPEQDAYWDSYNPSAEGYRNIRVPVLTLTGIYDGDQLGALLHYRQHLEAADTAAAERHYLVIGPWDHAGARQPRPEVGGLKLGASAMLDLRKLHLEWFDWVMRGASRPEFLKDRVAYYVLGSERWRYARTLEAVTCCYQTLFLSSLSEASDVFHSGSLTEALSSGLPDEYVYDPRSTEHASVERALDPECLVDMRLVHLGSPACLVYHSAPFSADLEVAGFFRLRAWISIDQADTDVRASVYEISASGQSLLLSSDWIRSRYRQSLRKAKLIHSRDPLLYDFRSFPFVARLISKGSRLRLVVGPISSIFSQKNFNSGGSVSNESMEDARPVRVLVFHDSEHPSVLQVPIAMQE